MDVEAGQDQTKPIVDDERLGRQEWSGSSARKVYCRLKSGQKVDIRANKFEPRTNHNDVSVDRMDLAAQNELAKLAEKNTTREGKLFRGWYTPRYAMSLMSVVVQAQRRDQRIRATQTSSFWCP